MSAPTRPAQPRDRPPAAPDAGVIEDARRRQRARRRRLWACGAAVAILVAIGGAYSSGGGGGGRPARGGKGHLFAAQARPPVSSRSTRIAPALDGGSYGWSVMAGGGGGCCTTPLRGDPLVGTTTADTATGIETASFLAGPELGGVLLGGRRLPMKAVDLPYHLRLIEVTFKRHDKHPPPGAVWPELRLTALDRQGHVLPRPRFYDGPVVESRWWKRGSRIPAGPCQLKAHGPAGLTAQWGHVANAIRPYGAPIVGRAFFSCIDTEFYLHKWPLDAAILLDAAHPGRRPGALPEMTPLPGAPGYYQEPAMWNGAITARREGRWWLLVAGGSGAAQRLEVLRHITATVKLPGH